MKTILRFPLAGIFLASSFFLISCEKNPSPEGTGTAGFSIQLPVDALQLKSTESEPDTAVLSWHLLVSIENEAGQLVISDELLPIYPFGPAFISENLELEAGNYHLVKFMVIDPSGEVVFASPLEGSPLAYLVNKPLPIPFVIRPDQLTILSPEVLAVSGQPPSQFGYLAFGIQLVRPLEFYVVCILDNPLIEAPTQFTRAKLTVYGPQGWHYTFQLEARINHLVIRGGAESYGFLLEKEGFPAQEFRLPAEKLAATTASNPLVLKIPWEPSSWKRLVLQPGPEEGIDAMISNLDPDKNFGDHPYFEATFRSEPILTVMRSNRSLIRFKLDSLPTGAKIQKVKLQLFFDDPIPVDSTLVPGPTPFSDVLPAGAVLQQVTENWDEYGVTWENQPQTLVYNQVYIPLYNTDLISNFIEVDVTRFFVNENGVSNANYGMLFRQYPSDFFPGLRFASSDNPNPGIRPRLLILYSTE